MIGGNLVSGIRNLIVGTAVVAVVKKGAKWGTVGGAGLGVVGGVGTWGETAPEGTMTKTLKSGLEVAAPILNNIEAGWDMTGGKIAEPVTKWAGEALGGLSEPARNALIDILQNDKEK
jgi:hypothetical protein